MIELAKREVYWLNCFPLTDGISETLSPRTIVTGQTVAFDHHCKYGFGDNVQTHEPHNNSMGSHVEMASHENDDVEAEHKNNDVKAKMEAAYDKGTSGRNLCPRRLRSYLRGCDCGTS